jgi:radical SAM superfamily enzyme YgiQ (UPF0313 family)
VTILLLGCYELGRQPFGLASPAAWLRNRGHGVRCVDLSRQSLDGNALREAQLIVFYLPMHTAARLALEWAKAIRAENPAAPLCAAGLYAPLNEALLRRAGFDFVLGAEFEGQLCELAEALGSGRPFPAETNRPSKIPRLPFRLPDRSDLPALGNYAHVVFPDGLHRTAGYTEASRGCKHLCRHCPIVPVYSGQFRVVPRDIVLADIRQQVAAGAEHITFGDPDFFNGVTHAVRIVEALHAEFPRLTYDATIKIEHLLRHADHLLTLARTGCLFVTSAVESLDDQVLRKLEKGHTRADFLKALELTERAGLAMQPTFVPFTPWTTRESYGHLLRLLEERDLVQSVPSVQLTIRLLIPCGSRLLELPEIRKVLTEFDSERLVYPWQHPEPQVDGLAARASDLVAEGNRKKLSRSDIFEQLWRLAGEPQAGWHGVTVSRRFVPYLTEPWYC